MGLKNRAQMNTNCDLDKANIVFVCLAEQQVKSLKLFRALKMIQERSEKNKQAFL